MCPSPSTLPHHAPALPRADSVAPSPREVLPPQPVPLPAGPGTVTWCDPASPSRPPPPKERWAIARAIAQAAVSMKCRKKFGSAVAYVPFYHKSVTDEGPKSSWGKEITTGRVQQQAALVSHGCSSRAMRPRLIADGSTSTPGRLMNGIIVCRRVQGLRPANLLMLKSFFTTSACWTVARSPLPRCPIQSPMIPQSLQPLYLTHSLTIARTLSL